MKRMSLLLSTVLAACGGKHGTEKSTDAMVSEDAGSTTASVDATTPTVGDDAGEAPPPTVIDGQPGTHGIYDVPSALPPLPHLENVVGLMGPDSVTISFLPVDDARDYRVYVLPADSDVELDGGEVHVRNAVYRCSGDREAPGVDVDGAPAGSNFGARTLVDGQDVDGHQRSLSDALLGYVYYAAAAGRLPVYALGDPHAKADNWAFISRFDASRTKLYTASEQERSRLLAAGWRDDGIAFYVPERGEQTTDIYTSLGPDGHTRYYFGDVAEKAKRKEPALAFSVLKAKTEGAAPLYRVFYTKYQAFGHDELVYSKTRFDRARFQGADQPLTQLHWAGITGPTTLVVEALDSGCPYPGRLAAAPIAQARVDGSATVTGYVDYAEAITPREAQATAPHGELYLNGQHDPTNAPRAVARAFLRVEPQKPEPFDWFQGFTSGSQPQGLTETDCGTPSGNCFQQWRQVSSEYDINWHTIVTGQRALGYEFGELWVRYADWAADTNGKFRITPSQKAQVNADSYLHATMEVTAITTGRRYPQLLISDRDAPIQDFLPEGNTIVLETFRNWPNYLELQVCDHRPWDVNNQCPFYQFYESKDANGEVMGLAPIAEVGERTAADLPTRFDLFLSSKRAYIILDRKPYGCVDLPTAGIPTGDVTVTFGDVLYHSDADSPLGFHKNHLQYDTERHFDNLGFSSGVAAPDWDMQRLPCVPASSIDIHR